MGVGSLGTIKLIVGGALPIWEQLATSLSSLAARCPKLAFKSTAQAGRGAAHRGQRGEAAGLGALDVIVATGSGTRGECNVPK